MILFDGDIIVYRAGYAADADPFYMLAPFHRSKMLVELIIRKAIRKLEDHRYQIYITNGDIKCNRRYHLAKTKVYKGNRKAEKPRAYNDIRKWMVEELGAIVVTGDEADDALGKRAHEEGVKIASIDKDLLTVPGLHYNLVTDEVIYSSNPGLLRLKVNRSLTGYGFKFFCAQMLMGDKADNVPGLKGYGDVKTYKTLVDKQTIRAQWAQVLRQYRKMKAMDRLDEIRQLLWIEQQHSFEELVYGK